MYRSGTVRRGGVISPYNRDGVLNLPHEQKFAWCKTLSKSPNDRGPDGIETGAQSKKEVYDQEHIQRGGRMSELKFRSYTGRCFVLLDLNNDNDFTFNEFCSCLGDSPIEQYTGLKDKNGKEIYEGDIVKYAWTRCNYIVAYRKYDASFVLENDDREEIILFQYNRQNDYEVIGTIHENPELLEEEE